MNPDQRSARLLAEPPTGGKAQVRCDQHMFLAALVHDADVFLHQLTQHNKRRIAAQSDFPPVGAAASIPRDLEAHRGQQLQCFRQHLRCRLRRGPGGLAVDERLGPADARPGNRRRCAVTKEYVRAVVVVDGGNDRH